MRLGTLEDGPARPARKPQLLLILMWLVATAFLTLWLLLVLLHINDRYALDHASGTQIALVSWLREGVFYPDLFDGSKIGGTRMFPVPIALYASVASLVGNEIVAGKLLNFLSVAALTVMVYHVARRSAHLGKLAALMVALVLPMSGVGLWMSTTIRYDAIASVLGFSALIMFQRQSKAADWGAGAFAALAVFARPTTAWSAFGLLHAAKGSSQLRRVVLSGIGSAVLMGMAVLVLTEGRFLDVLSLTISRQTGINDWLIAPYRVISRFERIVPLLILIPFVLLGWNSPRAKIFRISLVYSLAITFFAFTDVGVTVNHFLDPFLLSLAISAFGMKQLESHRTRHGGSVVAATLLVIGCLGLLRVFDEIDIRNIGEVTYPVDPVQVEVAAESETLFEDPGLALARGEMPLVLDPFMVSRLPGETGAAARSWLQEQIEREDLELIVLRHPIESHEGKSVHFTPEIWTAVQSHYCQVTDEANSTSGFFVYRPCDT